MLTCDSSEFLEGWHTNSLALRLLVVPQKRRKALQRGSVKNSLGRDANQHFFPKQNLQQLFRAGLLDSQLRKNLFRQGRRQTGFCERLLDLLCGTLFFERQGDSRAGFLYELRVQYQFFLLHERFKRGPERFWPHALSEGTMRGSSATIRTCLVRVSFSAAARTSLSSHSVRATISRKGTPRMLRSASATRISSRAPFSNVSR